MCDSKESRTCAKAFAAAASVFLPAALTASTSAAVRLRRSPISYPHTPPQKNGLASISGKGIHVDAGFLLDLALPPFQLP